jgi:hypothetical protein
VVRQARGVEQPVEDAEEGRVADGVVRRRLAVGQRVAVPGRDLLAVEDVEGGVVQPGGRPCCVDHPRDPERRPDGEDRHDRPPGPAVERLAPGRHPRPEADQSRHGRRR